MMSEKRVSFSADLCFILCVHLQLEFVRLCYLVYCMFQQRLLNFDCLFACLILLPLCLDKEKKKILILVILASTLFVHGPPLETLAFCLEQKDGEDIAN